MPVITISETDLLHGKIVEPAWYVVEVNDVNERTARSGTSQNFFIDGTIIENADNGEKTYAGVKTPPSWLFNEKGMGFAVGFLDSIGEDVSKPGRFDLDVSKGKRLEVFIENDVYEGRTVNKINHKYRKLGAGKR